MQVTLRVYLGWQEETGVYKLSNYWNIVIVISKYWSSKLLMWQRPFDKYYHDDKDVKIEALKFFCEYWNAIKMLEKIL